MKFWFSPHKNFTDQPGRFVYDSTPQNDHDCDHEIFSPSEEERNLAIADTDLALDDLRASIEEQNGIENLGFEEKLNTLLRIARNEATYDTSEDERLGISQVRDSLGALAESVSGFTGFGENLTRRVQEATDYSSEAYIVGILKDDAILTRFLADYKTDSFNLFTDYMGTDDGGCRYRAKFFGNRQLERQANFMEMLPNDGEHKYLVLDGSQFVRTPSGYVGFHPSSIVGQRAQIESDTWFTVKSDLREGSDEARNLVSLKENNAFFSGIDNDEAMAALESNRRINYQTSLIWKKFMDEVGNDSQMASAITGMDDLVKNPFKQFLDGNFFLSTLLNESGEPIPGKSFSIPGVEGLVPPLTADMSPSEYRTEIDKALSLIQDFLFKMLNDAKQELAETDNFARKGMLQLKIRSIESARTKYFNATTEFIAESQEFHEASLNANNAEFVGEVDPSISPEEVREILDEFDLNIRELIEEGYSEPVATAIAQKLVGDLYGSANTDLDPSIRENLISLMYARINIMAKEPGFEHLQASNNLRRTRSEIFTQAQSRPRLALILSNNGIQKPSDLSAENLEKVATEIRSIIEANQLLEPEKTESLQSLLVRIERFTVTMVNEEDALDNALDASAQTEAALAEVSLNYRGLSNPTTPEGITFREQVDVHAQFVSTYRQQNNGQRPMISLDDAVKMQQMHRDGVAASEINNFLSQQANLNQRNTNIQNQTNPSISANQAQLPSGVNIIGKTPDGQNIVQIPGSSNDRFIQDPNDNTFIAEKFANVPDREDLKTDNLYLAQIYSAFTNGGVVQSPLRNIAQAAEKNGSVATTKLISNYLIGANRSENYTMTPNEALQWEQLGQMCNDYNIGIDAVFARLSGTPRMDGRVNSNPTDNGTLLVQMLETATAGNRSGFEDLMGINTPNRLA